MPADEKHLESVANAWINARESPRAEAALKKLAAMSDKGEYFFKLGAMYGDNERWKDSKEALQKAIAERRPEARRRGLDAPGGRRVQSQERCRTPSRRCSKAMRFDESRKQAGEWLRHLTGQPWRPISRLRAVGS